MDFPVESVGDTYIVRLSGRLDISGAEAFEREILKIIGREPKNLVINLSQVTYLSSSGIRTLLSIYRMIRETERQLVLCETPPDVRKVLDMVEISHQLKPFDLEREALQSLQ